MTEPTDRLRRYGEDIASAVSPARSRVAAMRAIGQAQRTPPRRTPRIAFATLGAFLALNVVTAGVANAAVPGDLLYPLDRGYEKVADLVGLGGDHSEERLQEAQVLLDRSDPEGAVDLIAEATDMESVEGVAASLDDLDRSLPDLPEHVQDLMSQVHTLVEARRQGGEEGVAEAQAAVDLFATQMREQVRSQQADDPGPPAHAGEGGPPPHAEETGQPDHTPEPNQGPPEGAGPPEEPGPPSSTPGNDPPQRDGSSSQEQENSGGNGPSQPEQGGGRR